MRRGRSSARSLFDIRRSIAVVMAVLPGSIGAQTNPFRVQDLAPGVFAIIREAPRGDGWDANNLVIVNDDNVVVVDANILPSGTREVIREIRKRTAKPVRYVINTHWHSDHHYGNDVYRREYPGVEFIQHRNTRRDILERDLPALKRNVETDYPAVVARIKRAIATGRTSRGDTVTSAMRQQFADGLVLYETFLREMKTTPLVAGTIVVQDSLVLQPGGRTIVIRYLGGGNTEGDLVVHLPQERIVATGDLVVHPVPFAFFSNLEEWPETLRRLTSLDAAAIVPGHGPVLRDWTYATSIIPVLESIWTQVRRAFATGADVEATMQLVNVDELRPGFGGETRRADFDGYLLRPAVQAAHARLANRAKAARTDSNEVLDVMHALFAAMRSKDTAAFRRLFAPGARLVGMRPTPDGGTRLQELTWERFATLAAGDGREWIERAFAPEVRVHGTLATVWVQYDFHFGVVPSHCGVDAFQLLKTGEGWRIVAIADTYETRNCVPRSPPR